MSAREARRPRVWILNLDAELELARPPHASPRPLRLDHPHAGPLLGTLVPPGDAIAVPGRRFEGHRVIAWCPTRGARAWAAAHGADFATDTPTPEVVREVLGRDWIAARRGLLLPGAVFARSTDEARAALRVPSPTGRLLLRARYGFAGKQRRACSPAAITPADWAFIDAAVASGGVLVEPLVEVLDDLSLHGFVGDELTLGRPVRSRVNKGGVWLSATLADDLSEPYARALLDEARGCAEELQRVGYRGPFGLDAFVYAGSNGPELAPRCELNARYTMAWALGMAGARPDLAESSS